MSYATNGDVSLYYEATGDGPALVFAHGAGGNCLIWWQQVPVFAERFRVVTFEHRGFGRSGGGGEAFHPKHFAGDLMAILDAEGIGEASLVCQSMGGWTGLHAALDHPGRVCSLVLCDTPGGIVTPEVVGAMRGIMERAQKEGIRAGFALAPDYPERCPEMTHLYDQIAALNPGLPEGALARLADEGGRIAPEQLAGFAIPTLLIAGENDSQFSPEVLRSVHAEIPGAEWREIPRAGHSTYFEEPAAFNEIVLEFLSRHR